MLWPHRLSTVSPSQHRPSSYRSNWYRVNAFTRTLTNFSPHVKIILLIYLSTMTMAPIRCPTPSPSYITRRLFTSFPTGLQNAALLSWYFVLIPSFIMFLLSNIPPERIIGIHAHRAKGTYLEIRWINEVVLREEAGFKMCS